MKPSTLQSISCLIVLALVSCGKDKEPEPPANQEFKPLSQRLDENNGYKVDANGNWVPQNDKRSSFEHQGQSQYANNKVGKKEYRTGDFSKKSWWGNKNYRTSSYQGNTDGSRYQTNASGANKRAGEAGTSSNMGGSYGTSGYNTGSARESRSSNFSKRSDRQTDFRREVFKQPEITDWRQQRSMTVDESRGILGR